ncbi:HAD family hydrolase [Sanguibacter suaedae]|uniref:HAD hydrolase family protein n=1 Tax=Sanguibacter suaedae TaxID=2795737 RepID=A0A934IA28_9MICO|nr:HAD hydrolase family protein [Sanguibacter suaedae]MBI9113985.1 HAD hydrolase family protein [Sanguibacter suaedae]
MTRPRLVATDLDGTLLTSAGTLSPCTRRALRDVEREGIEVVFVTARPPRWLPGLADAVGGHGHIICLNGACVYEVATRAVSAVHGFDPSGLRAIVADLRGAAPGVALGLEGPDGAVLDPGFLDVDDADDIPGSEGVLVSPVESALDAPGAPTVGKLLARHPGLPRAAFLADVLATVGDRALLAHSGAAGLAEMTAPGVTKAAALARWCTTHDVPAADVWAFGDMPNDLPMLRWAGRSFAVANADPEVLAAATDTTSSNDEDGVARVLEALLAR